MTIAVVGAGVAGLTCAGVLRDAGKDVTVFEKARGPSGRLSTRRSSNSDVQWDHGAQFFTARDPLFAAEVARWEDEGVVAPWQARFARRVGDRIEPYEPDVVRWVGTPRMSALGRRLARGVELVTGVRVGRVESGGRLVDDGGRELGRFDAVVLAVPAPQAVPLLATAPRLAERAGRSRMTPCLALMLAFEEPTSLPFDALDDDGPFQFVARNSSKPGRPRVEAWVAHLAEEPSRHGLEEEPEERTERWASAFFARYGIGRRPLVVQSHRWRYARGERSEELALADAEARVVVCGDWLAGPRVEGAWRSGRTAAARLLDWG